MYFLYLEVIILNFRFGKLTGFLLKFFCDVEGTFFDVSQYAFFGKDGVELGVVILCRLEFLKWLVMFLL